MVMMSGEPLWRGKTQDPIQASENIDLDGRDWSILQLLIAASPCTEVEVWPAGDRRTPTREQVHEAIATVYYESGFTIEAATDAVLALLHGQEDEPTKDEVMRTLGGGSGEWWVRTNPAEAVKVLLETGALSLYADCGRCAGRDVCQWVHSVNPEDIPECVPVYRLVTEENHG